MFKVGPKIRTLVKFKLGPKIRTSVKLGPKIRTLVKLNSQRGAKGNYSKFGCSYKNFSLRKSLISDAVHCKIASCKLHMHMSLTEDINEINEIPPQS